ncbi:MAG: amidohydrolase [Actinobacteria bacterium]|nr:amidohydrolase [Actinomycetota bacterium]
MKYFDIHQHYNFLNWRGTKIKDFNNTPGEYFEKKLVEYCKKLDMKVAVNGYGRCDKSSIFMDMNYEVEKFFKNNEEYIVGIGYIDLDYDIPPKIDELFKKGFKGIKVIWPKNRYDNKIYYEFYRRCEYFCMPVLFHTGVSGIESYFKEDVSSFNMQPIFLEAIGLKFPKLKIIGAHLGYAMYDVACAVAKASTYGSSNIFFDISGSDISLREIPRGGYIKRDIPVSQILWGLDEPFTRYEEIINMWKEYFIKINLNNEEQDKIFYKNTCEIFNM